MLWHTSSPLGRGDNRVQGDFWQGEAAALPLDGQLAAQGEASCPAGLKLVSSALSYMAEGEAKTLLWSEQGEWEARRKLLLGAAAQHWEQHAALLHSPSYHQREINAHVCSLMQVSVSSWLILTSFFNLDRCKVEE